MQAACPAGRPIVPDLEPPLISSIAQQLQQSGFMQHLPRLLSTAANALSELQAQEANLRDVPQTFGFTHPSLPARWQHQGMPEALLRVVALQDCVIQLLGVQLRILVTWPEMMGLQDVGAATLQLCVASMQHVSRCADMYPADAAAPPDALEAIMSIGYEAAHVVLTASSLPEIGFDPDAAALLQSPWALQAVSILLLLTLTERPSPEALATAGSHSSKKTARDIPSASRTSDRSTGSSSATGSISSYSANAYLGSNRINRLLAWQYACKHENELPEPQLQLLKALKCSHRVFLFTATHPLVSESLPGNIQRLMRAYVYVIEQHQSQDEAAHLQQPDSAAAQPSEAAASTLAVSQLCSLMPSVILRWASQQKLGKVNGAFFSTFACALMACSDALDLLLLKANTDSDHDGSCSEQAMDSLTGREQQQHTHSDLAAQVAALTDELQQAAVQQQPETTGPEQQSGDTVCAADAGTSTSAAAAEWLPPADRVAELLRHAYKALRKLLQLLEKVLNTPGSSSNPGSSSSSSLASLREQHLTATLQPQATSSCCCLGAAVGDRLVLNLLLLCKATGQHTAGSGLKLGQSTSTSTQAGSTSTSSSDGNSRGCGSSGHSDSERTDSGAAPSTAAKMFQRSMQRHALLLMATTEAGIRIRSAEFSSLEAVETGISFLTTAFPYLATRDGTQQEQQQIFSLACSVLKAVSLSSNLITAEPLRLADIWRCCCAVMKVAAVLLDRTGSGPLQTTGRRFSLPSGDVPDVEPTARTSMPGASLCSELDSPAGSLQLPPFPGEDATLILHWLVLMGRCFLVWAMVLQHLMHAELLGSL